ncbi:hybrid sensor histidine kinase/response regulator [Rhodospirillum rubrum]|uniref:sensor histidine kinase n=1 Tax=Rhodospirillum rubrum TaxID=1085 RepID=UPI0019040490|nr:ATP-binding protein [Rhodospirillum rubrum]MBK1664237.1 hybrid sensor histidine kinase/response regulator [Rhodospirillum rubrum]MBK1675345.1 hybrid sensor histidine kinase/response regulator [Rhodospirillum rubrum]
MNDPIGDPDLLLVEDDLPGEDHASPPASGLGWKVLIVDDDLEVHLITRTVLANVTFKNRPLLLLSAHSAEEARGVLASEPDIAAILLDVVMESDDAGLRLVRHIREVLGNRAIRIILRTGQPGQAPEREVIVAYDINDYKAKTELTSQKLFTTIVAALRAYCDIIELENGRKQLERANSILEQRVADRTAALARSNAELESFAYGISHDLQEPLRMVRGYLQLIRRRLGSGLDSETRDYMAFAEDGATRMGTMINDLLDYSRITTQPARFEPVDLRRPLDLALGNLTLAISESGAALTLPEEAALISGDEGQLARLFQNLIGNALKYRHPERHPDIRVVIEALAFEQRPGWKITVTDNGRGIARKDFDTVFNLFRRLDSGGPGGVAGSGVGLALCRRIVERHGGRIWVDSVIDEGSSFRVHLPAGLENSAPPPEASDPPV